MAAKKPKNHCARFLEWVNELGEGNFLYRGTSNEKHNITEASICRRFRNLKDNDNTIELTRAEFINANEQLLESAKLQGYDQKDGNKMSPLEMLADLQHYGAATCLIDFTKSPLTSLWFACSKNFDTNGKVVAFSTSAEKVKDISTKQLNKTIANLLSGNIIWTWEPQKQNERIIAQQSVFVFGDMEIKISQGNEHLVKMEHKQVILEELERYGFTEESLFPDFDGFARVLNAHNRQYTEKTAKHHYDRGLEHYKAGNYEEAIGSLTQVIDKHGNTK